MEVEQRAGDRLFAARGPATANARSSWSLSVQPSVLLLSWALSLFFNMFFRLWSVESFPFIFWHWQPGITNLIQPPSSFLLHPHYCRLRASSIPFRAIVNNKQCEARLSRPRHCSQCAARAQSCISQWFSWKHKLLCTARFEPGPSRAAGKHE